eukprot:6094484-Pleurochrysis_carterae.AAC.1
MRQATKQLQSTGRGNVPVVANQMDTVLPLQLDACCSVRCEVCDMKRTVAGATGLLKVGKSWT